MEADWSVDCRYGSCNHRSLAASGDDEPKCRFIDLREYPHLIAEIEEAQGRLALRSALLLLNGSLRICGPRSVTRGAAAPSRVMIHWIPTRWRRAGRDSFWHRLVYRLVARDLEIPQRFEARSDGCGR